jgi:hypothetical protein
LDDLFQDSSAISVGTPDVPGLLSHARVRFEELRAVESKGGGGFRRGCWLKPISFHDFVNRMKIRPFDAQ